MTVSEDDIREQVRDSYGKIAADEQSGCCGSGDSSGGGSSCCGTVDVDEHAEALGYEPGELLEIPEDANLGLGCGNPTAIANLEPGQVVLNLSPDKRQVFREAYRVLKPGGRLAVSDICLSEPLPEAVREAAAAHVACIGGALEADDYLEAIRQAGFTDIDWTRTSAAPMFEAIREDAVLAESIEELGDEGLEELDEIVWSYRIEAHKP